MCVGHRFQGKPVASEKTGTRVPMRIKDAEALRETTVAMFTSTILREDDPCLEIQILCKRF